MGWDGNAVGGLAGCQAAVDVARTVKAGAGMPFVRGCTTVRNRTRSQQSTKAPKPRGKDRAYFKVLSPTVGTDSVNLRPSRGDYGKMAEEHEVLTTEEAAALLRVSTKTVLSLARTGTLPGEKVGRAWRFLRTDVLSYVRGTNETKGGTSR